MRLTSNQLAQAVGRTAVLKTPQAVRFLVTILDARVSYGRTQYQITPQAGDGSAWVDETSVRFPEAQVP